MDKFTIFHGTTHYFDWAIFNSYVSLLEGKPPFSYGFPMGFPIKTFKINELNGPLRPLRGPSISHYQRVMSVPSYQDGEEIIDLLLIHTADSKGVRLRTKLMP